MSEEDSDSLGGAPDSGVLQHLLTRTGNAALYIIITIIIKIFGFTNTFWSRLGTFFKPTSLVPSSPPLLVVSSSSLRPRYFFSPPLFQTAPFARSEKPRRSGSRVGSQWRQGRRRRRLLKRDVLLSLGATRFDAGEGEKFGENT